MKFVKFSAAAVIASAIIFVPVAANAADCVPVDAWSETVVTQPFVPGVPAIPAVPEIPEVPAVMGTVTHPAIPAVTEQVEHAAVEAVVKYQKWEYRKHGNPGSSTPAKKPGDWKTFDLPYKGQDVGVPFKHGYTWYMWTVVTVSEGIPAWSETIIITPEVPAWDETVELAPAVPAVPGVPEVAEVSHVVTHDATVCEVIPTTEPTTEPTVEPTVGLAAAPAPRTLAETGNDLAPILPIGIAFLAIGGLVLFAVKHQARSTK